MLIYWRKGKLAFTTDIEDWMTNQEFTEVFSYRGSPSVDEMSITEELDNILHTVRYGKSGIAEELKEMMKSDATLVAKKQPVPGQQSLNSVQGMAVDEVFKGRLLKALDGRLKKWKGVLETTPQGFRGADVISRSLGVAWDVTTKAQVWIHVERDVFGKRGDGKPRIGDLWDRYYLLVWDEPRTYNNRHVAEIESGRIA